MALEPAAPARSELEAALAGDLDSLVEALDRSLEWFENPSSREYFPMGGITHARARASVLAFRSLLLERGSGGALADRLREEFDWYASVGRDGRGTVLFTGYYSPVFRASRTRDDEYRYPLYGLPDDLAVDEATGRTLGRRVGGRIVPYPTRAEIESAGMLAGRELAWLRDAFDAFLIHVQGSAALELTDGSTLRVAYAGNNGREYTSIALELVADGKLAADELSLEEVRAHFAEHPEDLEPYLRRNDRFIFFREEQERNWPAGSLGVKVTALATLATDKSLFPPGGVVLVTTSVSVETGVSRRLTRFMLDQDTGGAIRSPGRADIYFGVGDEAERVAGGQYQEGRLYYLFLKPELVERWSDRMR